MLRPGPTLLACAVLVFASACSGSAADVTSSTEEVVTTSTESSTTATTATPAPSTEVESRNLLAVVRQDPDTENTDIYLIDESGTESRLTDDESYDEYPAISPDGTRLTFDSYRTGDWETFVIDVDGTGLRQLTDTPGEDGYSSWAPDGDRLALDSQRDGDYEIYVLDIDEGSFTQLTDNDAWDGDPAWSPDGERIAFHSNRDGDGVFDLYLMNVDGSDPIRLTENGFTPSWSPDGTLIAFTKEPTNGGDSDIWVIDVETGEERLLAGGESWDDEPAWSRDGSSIYFTSDRDGPFQVYSMDPDGGNVELVAGGAGDVFAPAVFAGP